MLVLTATGTCNRQCLDGVWEGFGCRKFQHRSSCTLRLICAQVFGFQVPKEAESQSKSQLDSKL